MDDEWQSGVEPMGAPAPPELTETENPVIAHVLGPSGETLSEVRERRTVAFGFARRPKRPSRVWRSTDASA